MLKLTGTRHGVNIHYTVKCREVTIREYKYVSMGHCVDMMSRLKTTSTQLKPPMPTEVQRLMVHQLGGPTRRMRGT